MLTIPRRLLCVGILCFVPLLIPVQQQTVIPSGTEDLWKHLAEEAGHRR